MSETIPPPAETPEDFFEHAAHHIAEFHADRDVIDDILRRLTKGETLERCTRAASRAT